MLTVAVKKGEGMIKLLTVLLVASCAELAMGEIVYGESQVFALGGVTSVERAMVPAHGLSLAAAPNPFRPSALITVSGLWDCRGDASLSIHGADGRKISDLLVPARPNSGGFSVVWDGRDGRGGRAPSGIYFVRLHAGAQVRVLKLAYCR